MATLTEMLTNVLEKAQVRAYHDIAHAKREDMYHVYRRRLEGRWRTIIRVIESTVKKINKLEYH